MLGCFQKKKKGKICRKGRKRLAQGQQRLLVSLRSILMLQARVQARQPPLTGEKWDLNQRELGLLLPALRGLCCLSKGHPQERGTGGAQPCLWTSLDAGNGHSIPGTAPSPQTLLQLWDGAHGGREGEKRTGPSSPSGCPSGGEKAKEQSMGTSRWFCPVPAPPTGPGVAAVPAELGPQQQGCKCPELPGILAAATAQWELCECHGEHRTCTPAMAWSYGSPCPPSSGFHEIFGCCPCKPFPGVDSRGTGAEPPAGRCRLCRRCCCRVPGPGGSPKPSSQPGLPGWHPAGSPGSGVLRGVRGAQPSLGEEERRERGRR